MGKLVGSALVVATCEEKWSTHMNDCSGFVKAVAGALGVILTGQANDIVDQIQKAPWQKAEDGLQAKQKAEAGMFVVAGLKDTPHGHVVVITPGPVAHGKYPTGYWGRLGGTGKKSTTINFAWTKPDLDSIVYAYRSF